MKEFVTAEIVIGSMFILPIDLVAALLDTTAAGWLIATPLQMAASGATTFWLWTKGGERATKIERQVIKQASNLLPWIPTCLVAFWIEAYIHNNKEG